MSIFSDNHKCFINTFNPLDCKIFFDRLFDKSYKIQVTISSKLIILQHNTFLIFFHTYIDINKAINFSSS